MERKIIGILIFGILLVSSLPVTVALETNNSINKENENSNVNIKMYKDCYLEASGKISRGDWPRLIGSNMWKIFWFRPHHDDRAFTFYWLLVYDQNAEFTIYTEENGDVLWQHDGNGSPQITIYRYYGIYLNNMNGDSLEVTLKGKVQRLKVRVRE